jgi:hypothetical protein
MFKRSDCANGNLGTYDRFRVAYMSIMLSAPSLATRHHGGREKLTLTGARRIRVPKGSASLRSTDGKG